MQDDHDMKDWLKEATLMHKIYSNSYLNISALAATDSSCSFFAVREPQHLVESHVPVPVNGIPGERSAKGYTMFRPLFWTQEVDEAPLNLRAWVLQERLLAPRVLHFGLRQLLWECCEMSAAECYPQGLPKLISGGQDAFFKSLNPQLYGDPMSGLHGEPLPTVAPYERWATIVRFYTDCGLTKGEDKLLAIAGIARHMLRLVRDEYICGMWRAYLASELLWRVEPVEDDSEQPPRRALHYRAPSFSWASIDGAVQAGEPSDTGLRIRIVDIDIKSVTDDTTGLVKNGSLLLQGHVQKFDIHECPPRSDGRREHILVINGIEEQKPTGPEWEPLGPRLYLDEDKRYCDPTGRDDLYCVPARTFTLGGAEWLYSLLLQVVDASKGSYRRFGLAMTKVLQERDIVRAQNGRPQEIPALSYQGGQHIIRLI